MPAPPLSNTFESGQPDTTVITAGNSGGAAGDAFSSITASPTYSTTHAKSGTLAGRFDTTATYAEIHVDWTSLGSLTTNTWFRAYCYFTAAPSGANLRLFGMRTVAGNCGFIAYNSTGKLESLNAAQTGAGPGSVNVAVNQWVRIEWRLLASTTVGEIEWWLYNTAEAPIGSFDEHVNNTGLVLGSVLDGVRFGGATASGPNSFVGWIDDVAVSSTGQIGPSGGVTPGPGDAPPIGLLGRGAGW